MTKQSRPQRPGKTQLAIIAELFVIAILAGIGPEYPDEGTVASSWSFLLSHPTELLHAALGVAVLGHIVAYTVKARRKLLPAIVLIGVVISVGSGISFVITRNDLFTGTMTAGWTVALLATWVDYFMARRAARVQSLK